MRIIFMGTPGFAVPCLQKLIDAGHDICGVFTQPDKPKKEEDIHSCRLLSKNWRCSTD